MTFNPIQTDRLIIRKFHPDDYRELYAYLSKENVVRYEPYEPYTLEQARREAEYRSNSEDFFAVTLKNGGLIGNLYLSPREFESMELGYVFDTRWQMNGYATESARAILNYGFGTLNAHRIKAECNSKNIRSLRLMERLGMRREAEFMQNVYFKKNADGSPIWQDTVQYAILKSEWEKLK